MSLLEPRYSTLDSYCQCEMPHRQNAETGHLIDLFTKVYHVSRVPDKF